jgi:hypothetical protein
MWVRYYLAFDFWREFYLYNFFLFSPSNLLVRNGLIEDTAWIFNTSSDLKSEMNFNIVSISLFRLE